MTNFRDRRFTVALAALAGIPLLLALTACTPSAPTPRPTGTSTTSAIPGASESPEPTESAEATVDAATVVVTASTISVFGTDGSTLASVTYRMDAADVAEVLAVALDEDATVTTVPESEGGGCPARTRYGFGGLEIGTPGGPGSAGFVGSGDRYDAFVSGPTTATGIVIETVAGQQVGSTRSSFEAAVGDEVVLDDYPEYTSFGFDIVNPEAGPYDHIGVQAWFNSGQLDSFLAPAAIGFIGDCG